MTTTMPDGRGLPPPTPSLTAPPSLSPSTTERGVTRISDDAAAKIAERAAEEVDGVVGTAPGGLAGLVPGARSDPERRRIDVDARVHDQEVTLDLTVGIEYPRPVRATLERLAQHLAARLSEYAGLRLERLDITVGELQPPRPIPQPRVR